MLGLTSKEHLFMRVILVVTLANAAIYYSIFRNLQALTVPWQFAKVAVLATAITLFALTANLEFWWRYQRRTDSQRFWGNLRFWQSHERDLGKELHGRDG